MEAAAEARERGARGRAFPPGPRARFPGELLLLLARDRLGFLHRLAECGDAAHLTIGRRHLFLFRHPDLVRDVLVTQGRHFARGRGLQRARLLLGDGLLTSEGEFHRRQRRLAQPAFHRQRIAGYARVMAAYAARTRDAWRDGVPIDAHAEMMRLTLAIAGKTLFDADVEGGEAAAIGEAMVEAMALFEIAVLPYTELLERLPLPWVRRFEGARARLDATVYRIIAERRASGADRGDLLSMLLAARDEEGDGTGMTDAQLRDEVLTLLLAGHETTASALAFSLWLLATHPAAQARLRAEAAAVSSGGALPTMDDVARLPFARAVLAETMRLHPPAWILGHQATADVEVGPWRVPAGSLCLMPQLLVHRDPRWWPAPDEFRPERWLEDDPARPRHAYFPFGGGARQCIGEQFAWTEGVLVLATLLGRWRIEPAPGAPPVRPRHGFTLRPAGEVRVVAREGG
jgi:cytochrome P450